MAARYAAVTFAEHTKPRMSVAKYLERRIIRAWKSFSRKPCRASVMMQDFDILTARRRSIMHAQPLASH